MSTSTHYICALCRYMKATADPTSYLVFGVGDIQTYLCTDCLARLKNWMVEDE